MYRAKDGRTALINASGNGHTAIVQVLVDAGADKEAKDDKVRDIESDVTLT
jgi:ankyrin repeat protein